VVFRESIKVLDIRSGKVIKEICVPSLIDSFKDNKGGLYVLLTESIKYFNLVDYSTKEYQLPDELDSADFTMSYISDTCFVITENRSIVYQLNKGKFKEIMHFECLSEEPIAINDREFIYLFEYDNYYIQVFDYIDLKETNPFVGHESVV
jgi:hypothetical protein